MLKPKLGFMAALIVSGLMIASGHDRAAAGPYDELVPRHLLGLVHAPEVHQELKLSPLQVQKLETLFRSIDARWFPSRILPADQQLTTLNELEHEVRTWFRTNTSRDQQQRLEQLLYYAQAGRMLLREDVAQELGLERSQQDEFAEAARATDETRRKLSRAKFGDPEIKSLQEQLTKCLKAERTTMGKIVGPAQRPKLQRMLGETFDPSKLKRIYAMAPEFATVEHWINSSPLTMDQLRGKVVLVHFYAFQCHNCHANFDIYKRWHDELTQQGVVVVGIQTPETKRERDPGAVRSAAQERQLEFPVLIDLESENWKAWGNTMWPTVYVVDKQGYIRHWWQGELNWKGATGDQTIENIVDELLQEDS